MRFTRYFALLSSFFLLATPAVFALASWLMPGFATVVYFKSSPSCDCQSSAPEYLSGWEVSLPCASCGDDDWSLDTQIGYTPVLRPGSDGCPDVCQYSNAPREEGVFERAFTYGLERIRLGLDSFR